MKMVEIMLLLLVGFLVSFSLQGAIADRHRRDTQDTRLRRLDNHCAFERIHVEAIQRDLEQPANSDAQDVGTLEFASLVSDDFRSVRLCMPESVTPNMYDPGDKALFCTKSFHDDRTCMKMTVALVRMYLR